MRVEAIVRQLCGRCRAQIHAVRLRAVVAAVIGLIGVRRLSVTAIGRGLPGRARAKHAIKRVDRLLSNGHLQSELIVLYRALARRIVRDIEAPVVLLDWTKVAEGLHALVAAVPIGGRALPIYVQVHPERRLSSRKVQLRFLLALREVLPPGCRPTIITDAGFQGPFFLAVTSLGWDFVGRVRGKTTVAVGNQTFVDKKALFASARTTPSDLGWGVLGAYHQPTSARFVLVRQRRRHRSKRWIRQPHSRAQVKAAEGAKEPWLVATSLKRESAGRICALYAARMQIEETFRDTKNHRFGFCLRDLTSSSARRLSVLLVLASIAFVAVVLIGLAVEHLGIHRGYQANTVHRRVLSLFTLGLAVLRHPPPSVLRAEHINHAFLSIYRALFILRYAR
jgi:hypothetical protein